MADLKDLLGDAYKEDMTFDEVNAVLAEKDLVDKSQFEGFVPKSLLEKANSEAADYKKKWKAASSEQERKAIEEAEQKAQAEEELKSLRRENKVSKYENSILLRNTILRTHSTLPKLFTMEIWIQYQNPAEA